LSKAEQAKNEIEAAKKREADLRENLFTMLDGSGNGSEDVSTDENSGLQGEMRQILAKRQYEAERKAQLLANSEHLAKLEARRAYIIQCNAST
jgi:hypothetical protein